MPVLESTDKKIAHNYVSSIAPKSALRHRPIDDSADSSSSAFPVAQHRASRAHKSTTAIDDIPEWKGVTRGHKDLPLHQPKRSAPPRRTKTAAGYAVRPLKDLSKYKKNKHWGPFHARPLLFLGTGMISMLVLGMVMMSLYGWCSTTIDDLRFGRPRTFQTDEVVGPGDSITRPSHFIALNLNRHIEIIEIAGDDPSHTRIFNGPVLYGAHDDLTPVTLRFVTPPGKKYPNMVVQFGDSQLIYLNEDGTFLSQ